MYELGRTNLGPNAQKETSLQKLMRDLDEAEKQIEEAARIREQLEYENKRLREEVKYLEDNARKQRPNSSGRPAGGDQEVSAVMLLRKECEGLKQENRGLKERI